MSHPTNLTWKEILAHLEVYLHSQKAEQEAAAEQDTARAKRRAIGVCLKRIPRWIYVLVIFLAALLTCLYYLGWLDPVKVFIYRLAVPK